MVDLMREANDYYEGMIESIKKEKQALIDKKEIENLEKQFDEKMELTEFDLLKGRLNEYIAERSHKGDINPK